MYTLLNDETCTDISVDTRNGILSIYDSNTGSTVEVSVSDANELGELIISAATAHLNAQA